MKALLLNKKFSTVLVGTLIFFLITTVYLFFSNKNNISVFNPGRALPIYSVDSKDNNIAITFDCAWGASDIPEILKTLREEKIKATFFVVGGWAEKYPDTVKMIASEGHDIANHSYSHLKMGSISREKIKEEIVKCSDLVKNLTGKDSKLFRAPYGDYNNAVIEEANKLGVYTIQWDVDSLDWKPGITQEEIKDRIFKKSNRGSIILFHNDTPHTSKILKDIITVLKEKNYKFLPVSQMIYKENYEIDADGRQKLK